MNDTTLDLTYVQFADRQRQFVSCQKSEKCTFNLSCHIHNVNNTKTGNNIYFVCHVQQAYEKAT